MALNPLPLLGSYTPEPLIINLKKQEVMKAKIIIAIFLLLGVSVGSASAQTIGAKVRHERVRMGAGVRSGEMTRPEAYRLGREQRHIRRNIHRARVNDGHIGPRERRHSRHIYRAKHNRRHRL